MNKVCNKDRLTWSRWVLLTTILLLVGCQATSSPAATPSSSPESSDAMASACTALRHACARPESSQSNLSRLVSCFAVHGLPWMRSSGTASTERRAGALPS